MQALALPTDADKGMCNPPIEPAAMLRVTPTRLPCRVGSKCPPCGGVPTAKAAAGSGHRPAGSGHRQGEGEGGVIG